MTTSNEMPVVIVGGGLAGLCCAKHLHAAGVPIRLIEATERVGGRVATDNIDGFLLDRGFQVFLTAYPEAQRVLNHRALGLRPFYRGALVQVGAERYRIADPWSYPLAGLRSVFAPVARCRDFRRVARLRKEALQPDAGGRKDVSTRHYLSSFGLSDRIVERFFQPFFGGVLLDRELRSSSTLFRFLFSMFAQGRAALPADGMQAIPAQIVASIPDGLVQRNAAAATVASRFVRLESGEQLDARAVVVATDATVTQRLLSQRQETKWNGSTTLWYAAEKSPVNEPILVLNGNGEGLVNHVCVPSDVHPSYAPRGTALISVSHVGIPQADDTSLEQAVRAELAGWFGAAVDDWSLLRVDRIPHALPRMMPGRPLEGDVLEASGVTICGDYLETPSINGAMVSGRRAAEAVIEDLRRQPE